MAQQYQQGERREENRGSMLARAGDYAPAWRDVRKSGASVAPLLVGAAVGLAAYALLSRAAPRGRTHVREGYDGIVATLNNLIAICHDGEYGFRSSAEAITDHHIKEVFLRAANRCRQGAEELKKKVRKYGGEPEQIGTVSGAAHRAWLNLKSAVTGRDELAILNEVERGEDVAKMAYETALQGQLPPDLREILHRHYNGVRQNHDKVRNLRNEMRAKPV